MREEKPLKLGRFWRPLPDIAVVRGRLDTYRNRTPGRLGNSRIIEVADTTYSKDSGRKRAHYLRCGIPEYWIVDLARRVVELRDMRAARGPVPVTYSEGENVPLILDGREHGTLAVVDLLP